MDLIGCRGASPFSLLRLDQSDSRFHSADPCRVANFHAQAAEALVNDARFQKFPALAELSKVTFSPQSSIGSLTTWLFWTHHGHASSTGELKAFSKRGSVSGV